MSIWSAIQEGLRLLRDIRRRQVEAQAELQAIRADVGEIKLQGAETLELLGAVWEQVRPRTAARIIFDAQIEGQPKEEDVTVLTLTSIQKCALSIRPVDARGNPAHVEGAPTWGLSDPALLDLQVAADGLSATVFARGPIGAGQVRVDADADLGEGVETITGLLDVVVIAAQAVSLVIATGTPENQ